MYNVFYVGVIVYLIIALLFAIIFQLMEKTQDFKNGLKQAGVEHSTLGFKFELLKITIALTWPIFLIAIIPEIRKKWPENTSGTKKRRNS